MSSEEETDCVHSGSAVLLDTSEGYLCRVFLVDNEIVLSAAVGGVVELQQLRCGDMWVFDYHFNVVVNRCVRGMGWVEQR